MRKSLFLGTAAGTILSVWSVVTMLWPISYRIWDIGRGLLFVAFAVALTALATSVARSRASALHTFASVAFACLAASGLSLTSYAIATRFFTHWIVQVPEYMRDYTYHSYTSAQVYLSANYSDLLALQLFSWAIGIVGLLVVAGTSGWCLGRLWLQKHAG